MSTLIQVADGKLLEVLKGDVVNLALDE